MRNTGEVEKQKENQKSLCHGQDLKTVLTLSLPRVH